MTLPNQRTSRRSAIGAMTALLALLAAASRAQDAVVEPAWSWDAPAAIEWCEPVGGERPVALLVATRGGALHLLNIITAHSKLDADVTMRPDVRFGGDAGRFAYAFTSSKILALTVTGTAEANKPLDTCLWQKGVEPDADTEKTESSDPEFRARHTSALPTPAGVLIARSDGQIAELSSRDGATLWHASLPKSADYRLLVDGANAAVIHRGENGVSATFFSLGGPNARGKSQQLAESMPFWMELTRDGLMAAWPGKIMLLERERTASVRRLKLSLPLRADAIDAYRPRDASKRPLLVALEADERASAHDLTTGEQAWINNLAADLQGRSQAKLEGNLVLITASSGAALALDAESGVRRAAILAGIGKPNSAGATDAFLFALRNAATRADGKSLRPGLLLYRTPLFQPGAFSAQRAKESSRTWRIEAPVAPKSALWPSGRLILVGERSLRAYVLPTD